MRSYGQILNILSYNLLRVHGDPARAQRRGGYYSTLRCQSEERRGTTPVILACRPDNELWKLLEANLLFLPLLSVLCVCPASGLPLCCIPIPSILLFVDTVMGVHYGGANES